MSYSITQLANGKFGITHPHKTVGMVYDTREDAQSFIKFITHEARCDRVAARAEAAWDDYCAENCDE